MLDDKLRLAMFPFYHMIQALRRPALLIYGFLRPVGADGKVIVGRLARGKLVIDKSFLHLFDGVNVEVKFGSALLSFWSMCPAYNIPSKNRLDGKMWRDGERNIIFYNATWTPLSPQHYPPEAFETL